VASPRDLRRIVLRIAGEAAGLLRDLRSTSTYSEIIEGTRNVDDTTIRADWEAEQLIIDRLRSEGLRGMMLTEERGKVDLGGGPLIFIVDPLDGSKNYLSGIPWSSVSIAVADTTRGTLLDSVVAGAVAPVFQEPPYSFSVDEGCFQASRLVRRPETPLPMIFSYFEAPGVARIVELYRAATGHKGPVRSLGSAALEIIYTALGRAEVFIDARARLRIVDIAAATAFARLCGSPVSDIRGFNVNPPVTEMSRINSLLVAFNEEKWRIAVRAGETYSGMPR